MAVASDQQYNIGEKAAVTLLYTYYIIAMQVHPKRRQKPTCLKIKLSYVRFCLVSDSSVGESGSIVGWTKLSSPIG